MGNIETTKQMALGKRVEAQLRGIAEQKKEEAAVADFLGHIALGILQMLKALVPSPDDGLSVLASALAWLAVNANVPEDVFIAQTRKQYVEQSLAKEARDAKEAKQAQPVVVP